MADYEIGELAMKRGATLITHLFNAMQPVSLSYFSLLNIFNLPLIWSCVVKQINFLAFLKIGKKANLLQMKMNFIYSVKHINYWLIDGEFQKKLESREAILFYLKKKWAWFNNQSQKFAFKDENCPGALRVFEI